MSLLLKSFIGGIGFGVLCMVAGRAVGAVPHTVLVRSDEPVLGVMPPHPPESALTDDGTAVFLQSGLGTVRIGASGATLVTPAVAGAWPMLWGVGPGGDIGSLQVWAGPGYAVFEAEVIGANGTVSRFNSSDPVPGVSPGGWAWVPDWMFFTPAGTGYFAEHELDAAFRLAPGAQPQMVVQRSGTVGFTLGEYSVRAVTDDGSVLLSFRRESLINGDEDRLALYDDGGFVREVVSGGDVTPSGDAVFAADGPWQGGAFRPAMNANGQIAFGWETTTGLWGVYRAEADGSVQTIVRQGQAGPVAPTAWGPIRPVLGMSETGSVVFIASLTGFGVTTGNNDVLAVGQPGDVRIMARESAAAPGGGWAYNGDFPAVTMLPDGRVVFLAELVNGAGETGTGLFVWEDGLVRRVVATGDVLASTGMPRTVDRLAASEGARDTAGGRAGWVNPGGQAAVVVRFTDDSWMLARFDTGPCRADFTGDSLLNFFDVSAFLTAYAQQDAAADLTGDASFNFFDVSVFLSEYAAGCP